MTKREEFELYNLKRHEVGDFCIHQYLLELIVGFEGKQIETLKKQARQWKRKANAAYKDSRGNDYRIAMNAYEMRIKALRDVYGVTSIWD